MAELINGTSLERIKDVEEGIRKLEMGRIAIDEAFSLMGTQLQGTLEVITELEGRLENARQEVQDLRDIAVIMQDINERQSDELAAANTRILTLERMAEDSQARERDRDQRIAELTEMIRGLQRKLGDTPGDS